MMVRLGIAGALLVCACPALATMTQLPGLLREPLKLAVSLPDGSKAQLPVPPDLDARGKADFAFYVHTRD